MATAAAALAQKKERQKMDEGMAEEEEEFKQEEVIPRAQKVLDPYHVNTVVYHHPCSDGFTAACIANSFLPNMKLIPCTHGDAKAVADLLEKVDANTNLLIVDFSFSLETMKKLKAKCECVLLLDHHISAQKELGHLPYCVFDMERSGAMLAWNYFHPDHPPPPLVSYVQDRDLWKHELPFSREFNTMQYAMPLDMEAYENLMANDDSSSHNFARMVADGIVVRPYLDQLIHKASWFVPIQVGGCLFAVTNCIRDLTSDVGDSYTKYGLEPALLFHWDALTKDIHCSLRSADRLPDVSIIAKKFGGGGHRNSASFKIKVEQLPLLLSGQL